MELPSTKSSAKILSNCQFVHHRYGVPWDRTRASAATNRLNQGMTRRYIYVFTGSNQRNEPTLGHVNSVHNFISSYLYDPFSKEKVLTAQYQGFRPDGTSHCVDGKFLALRSRVISPQTAWTLKIKAAQTCETPETTRRHILEALSLRQHRSQNLKSRKTVVHTH